MQVPKKNISRTLDEVRDPKKRKRQPVYIADLPLTKDEPAQPANSREYRQLTQVKKNTEPKGLRIDLRPAYQQASQIGRDLLRPDRHGFAKIAIILLLIFGGIYTLNLLSFKDLVTAKISVVQEEFLKGKEALGQLDPTAAENAFVTAGQELSIVQKEASNYGLGLIPFLNEIPKAINNVNRVNQASLAIAQNISYLKNNGLELALNNGGDQIIKTLEQLRSQVNQLIALNTEIKNQSDKLKGWSAKIAAFTEAFQKEYLNISLNLYQAKDWLEALLAILKLPGEQHLLVILQNPSEMRPAGGFIGSHADVTIENGSVKNIVVDDIYNADRQMDLKTVPPKQLQSLTTNWGARDANWFFNFPTSARKVIYFLENSDLYKEKSIKFLGAAAINVDILESLLEITGPIEVPQYQLTLTNQNFLREVQYEVEAGRDKKPGQNPKKILSVVAPLILDRLTGLAENQKGLVLDILLKHSQNKDILFYFKDFTMEDLAVKTGLAGEIYATPQDFRGDYLAVVNANIAAGKTDAFINQRIILKSEVKIDGTVDNYLTIERKHSGQNEKEWWYTTDNKDFIKILSPQNSRIKEIKGNYYKPADPQINYQRAGYEYDLDLQGIEDSDFLDRWQTELGQEMDKSYFATWFNVPAGATKKLELRYDNPYRMIIQNGAVYKFIFDKQSGAKGSLEYSVLAPIGYAWKETGNGLFEYSTPNPKSREIIELTLEKI